MNCSLLKSLTRLLFSGFLYTFKVVVVSLQLWQEIHALCTLVGNLSIKTIFKTWKKICDNRNIIKLQLN